MKKNRRWLALVLATIMVLSLAACGGNTGSTNSGTATTNSGSTAKTETKTDTKTETPAADTASKDDGAAAETPAPSADYGTYEEILARDRSEHYTIEYAGIQLKEGFDFTAGNDYVKWWSDTFNIDYEATALTFENWVERMNTWLNADDIPEWCVWNFNAGDAANYVDQELIRKFPDDWKERWPNVAASQELVPLAKWCEEQYGGTYFIFRPVFATNYPTDLIVSHMAAQIRTDWGEEAGIDMSKYRESGVMSIGEYVDYLQAVKDKGITEYPFYGTAAHLMSLMDVTCEASGVAQSAYYKGADGKYHWGPAEEETGVKESLRTIKQMYDNGLIYPDFYTLTNNDDYPYFHTAGTAASYFGEGMAVNMDRNNTYMRENLGLSYFDIAKEVIITDNNGITHGDPSTNYWACNIVSPYMDEAKFERMMDMWDFSCTEYGQMCVRMGIPEVDWTWDENGNLVNLLEGTEQQNVTVKYEENIPVIYVNMVVLSDDFGFVNPAFVKEARDAVTEMYKTRAQIASFRGEEVDWDRLSYSSQALNLASMQYADEYSNLITKEGDFDANYDQWVKDKMAMVQPVLDDMNALFTE